MGRLSENSCNTYFEAKPDAFSCCLYIRAPRCHFTVAVYGESKSIKTLSQVVERRQESWTCGVSRLTKSLSRDIVYITWVMVL